MPNNKLFSPEEIKDKLASIVWDQNNPYVMLFLENPIGFIKTFENLYQESENIIKSAQRTIESLERIEFAILGDVSIETRNMFETLDDSKKEGMEQKSKFLNTSFLDSSIPVRAFYHLKCIIEDDIQVSAAQFTIADIVEKIPISLLVKRKKLGKKTICDLQNYFADHDVYLREDVKGYEMKRRSPIH